MNLLKKFLLLSLNERSIIGITSLYHTWIAFWNIFLNTYIFFYFWGIGDVLYYNLLYWSSIYFWFVLSGAVWRYYNLNVKFLYYLWFLGMSLAFFLLLLITTSTVIPIFWILYWLSFWAYWTAAHTYELNFIERKRRPIYSSIVVLSRDFFGIIVPLWVSLLFFISETYFSFSTYTVLFTLFWCINLLTIVFVKDLSEYYFKKFSLKSILRLYSQGNIYQTLYFFNQTLVVQLGRIVIVILMIYIFQSEVQIGFFQALSFVFALVSWINIWKKLDTSNILFYMTLFAILIALNFVILLYSLDVFSFFVFLVIYSMIFPLYGICDKVVLMEYMGDISKLGDNFLNQITQRETIFFLARFLTFWLLFLLSLSANFAIESIIHILIIICAISFLMSVLLVYLEKRYISNS